MIVSAVVGAYWLRDSGVLIYYFALMGLMTLDTFIVAWAIDRRQYSVTGEGLFIREASLGLAMSLISLGFHHTKVVPWENVHAVEVRKDGVGARALVLLRDGKVFAQVTPDDRGSFVTALRRFAPHAIVDVSNDYLDG